MADCPHTIGVEFGTRIIEVSGQKIKLQIWLELKFILSIICHSNFSNYKSIFND